MIERFLKQTKFTSEQDFKEHLEFIIPEDFNFAYDVMDEWAKIKPDHVALLWASERGEEIRFTYKDLKEQSDKAAAYFQSLGIGHDDKVMLILKRHYQWWARHARSPQVGCRSHPCHPHAYQARHRLPQQCSKREGDYLLRR